VRKVLTVAVATAAAGLTVAAPAASAAVTIGTPLQPSTFTTTAPGPTLMTVDYPGAQLSSPIDGVVVRYRVQASDWGNVALRVLRPAGAGAFDAVGTSIPAFVGGASDDLPHVQAAQLPIAAGDQIGIDTDDSFALKAPVSGGHYGYWSPRLGDTDPPSAPNIGSSDTVALFNADVEADTDHDGFGDETQDNCPGVTGPQVGCAIPSTTTAKKKKCKRSKKHRSAESAKKKCKKRKR
jgi:hypothetical protein